MKRFLLLFLLLAACANPQEKVDFAREHAILFFDTYKARTDWKAFQDLYAEDLVFKDVIFRYTYNKEEFINFYNWPDPLLEKHPDYPEVLVLEDLTTTDSTAMGRGYFTPFYYNGQLYDDAEHMRFVISLQFDEQGKIKRHTDFIEYPPQFLVGLAERLMNDSTATN
ncbi:MAG: hypothetical protein HEP71_20120 [Roseivirga sp.]|nr:hypothetical protein [Roseivirga sp.]